METINRNRSCSVRRKLQRYGAVVLPASGYVLPDDRPPRVLGVGESWLDREQILLACALRASDTGRISYRLRCTQLGKIAGLVKRCEDETCVFWFSDQTKSQSSPLVPLVFVETATKLPPPGSDLPFPVAMP